MFKISIIQEFTVPIRLGWGNPCTVTKTLQKLNLSFLLKHTLNVIIKANLQGFCSKSKYFWYIRSWNIKIEKICNILLKTQCFLMNEVSKYQDWLISFGNLAKMLLLLGKISDFTCFFYCGWVRGIITNWKLYSNRSLWPNLSNESNFEFGKIPRAEIPKLYFVYNLEFWPQLNSAAVAQSV